VDLKTGAVKEVLKNHPSMVADPNYLLKIDGKPILKGDGTPFVVHVNGIALSKDDAYFYYRPEIGTKLYRMPTQYLADLSLSDEILTKHIEDLGNVGQSNGMMADSKGNIYLTDAANKMIKRRLPDGKIEILAQSDDFYWTDSLALDEKEEYLYVSLAQVNQMSWFNEGVDKTIKPYKIVRIKL
jgi:sugar lactone lactonase YvrE